MLPASPAIGIFQASISPKAAAKSGPPGSLTTGFVTCSVQNEVPPVSYLWEKVSGDDVAVSSTTSSTVKFSATGSEGQRKTAVFKCTATDSDGVPNVDSDTVSVSFLFESGA